MTRRFRVILLISLLLYSISCDNGDKPEDLIEEDRYVSIFSQLLVLNQITDDQLGPVSRDSLVEQVFEQYSITEDRFNRSHNFYQRNPEKQIEVINKVENNLKSERDEFQDRLNKARDAARDSAALSDTL